MNPSRERPGEETIDTGDPVTELEDLLEPPSTGFLFRLRNKIERRKFSSNLIGMAWSAAGSVILEFLEMLFGSPNRRDKGDRQ